MSFCFFGEFFRFFLVTAVTSVEGTFHSVFFFFLRLVTLALAARPQDRERDRGLVA